jgi:hypothetical protein
MKSMALAVAAWAGTLITSVALTGCGGGSSDIANRDGGTSDATFGDS